MFLSFFLLRKTWSQNPVFSSFTLLSNALFFGFAARHRRSWTCRKQSIAAVVVNMKKMENCQKFGKPSVISYAFSSCTMMAASTAHSLNFGQTCLWFFYLLVPDLRQTSCKHKKQCYSGASFLVVYKKRQYLTWKCWV